MQGPKLFLERGDNLFSVACSAEAIRSPGLSLCSIIVYHVKKEKKIAIIMFKDSKEKDQHNE